MHLQVWFESFIHWYCHVWILSCTISPTPHPTGSEDYVEQASKQASTLSAAGVCKVLPEKPMFPLLTLTGWRDGQEQPLLHYESCQWERGSMLPLCIYGLQPWLCVNKSTGESDQNLQLDSQLLISYVLGGRKEKAEAALLLRFAIQRNHLLLIMADHFPSNGSWCNATSKIAPAAMVPAWTMAYVIGLLESMWIYLLNSRNTWV